MAVQKSLGCVGEWPPVLLMCLMILMPSQTQAAITCTAVTTRINTTVTCHFGQNIGESKHNFNLQFYDPDITANPKTLLGCNFAQSGDLVCHEEPGISFDKVVTDQAEVIGPPAVDKVGGLYVCQVVPGLGNGRAEPCNLTFQEIPREHATSLKPPYDNAQDTAQSSEMPHLQIITFVLVLLMALLLLVRALIILYRRFQRTRGSESRGFCSEEENSDTLDLCCFLFSPGTEQSRGASSEAILMETVTPSCASPDTATALREVGTAVDPGHESVEEECTPAEALLEPVPEEGHQMLEVTTGSERSPREERETPDKRAHQQKCRLM